MSKIGQARRNAPELHSLAVHPAPIVALGQDYPPGHRIEPHWHDRGQLVHGIAGVMTVMTESGRWLVPPGFAVWVPAGTVHSIATDGRLRMRTVYVDEERITAVRADACRVVTVPPLLHHLILRAIELRQGTDAGAATDRLLAVLIDELLRLEPAPLELPLPRDRRAARIADSLLADPTDRRTLSAWARVAGASERTLARLFIRDTGLGFRAWRQRLRLLRAVELLAKGRPVTAVALDVGYDSPSAFIAAFRANLESTPRDYVRGKASDGQGRGA
jgi:AraC-like DNA-binding protein